MDVLDDDVDNIGFEFDFGMKLERAQHDVLLQLDVDEPDDDSDDDDECDVQSTTVLEFGGITIKTAVFTSLLLLLFVSKLELLALLLLFVFDDDAFINGESSMNANVFFRSSNVNEQLESLGVAGVCKGAMNCCGC